MEGEEGGIEALADLVGINFLIYRKAPVEGEMNETAEMIFRENRSACT